MSRYFRSKVGPWYYLVILFTVGIMLGSAALPWVYDRDGALLATLIQLPLAALTIGFELWLLFSTGYTLEPTRLLVRSGPFSWTVALAEIQSISPTNSPLSSPALSFDRLLIRYGKHGQIMISPAEKQAFLSELEAARFRLLEESV